MSSDSQGKKNETGPDWKDTTSYSRSERGKKEPSSWEAKVGNGSRDLAICIHRYFGLDGWFVSCHEIGVEKRETESESIEEAKKEGVDVVRNVVEQYYEAISAV